MSQKKYSRKDENDRLHHATALWTDKRVEFIDFSDHLGQAFVN
jgi:hypothetical protein